MELLDPKSAEKGKEASEQETPEDIAKQVKRGCRVCMDVGHMYTHMHMHVQIQLVISLLLNIYSQT